MHMIKKIVLFFSAVMLLCLGSCSKYETVKGDPMKTKIYTLDNGLKVYMSVNKNEPRVEAHIAVRVGGKNDPSDNTGLAHYLEHLMFKGTEKFGTSDYAAEKPLLDKIEELFNVYRTKTDPAERKDIYRQIDSLSYQASLISIPNEYDKLMSAIGAQGTNAYTSNDVTCYTENIPSNQIENWAKIQSDRFKNMVIRGFHTELEAVYEEFNMYMNDDDENALVAIDSVLYKKHPYGLQQVIGTQNHLKNPSVSAIKKQKSTYYVPNNAAICVSGDFNPDEFIKIIKKYFGDWKPNPDLPVFSYMLEDQITSPVEKDVYGTESEFVLIGWRLPGEIHVGNEVATLANSVLYNGKAGLIDVDLIQMQKLLDAGSFLYRRTDYDELLLQAYPKEGQSLDDVRNLVLEEVAKLRSGDFDEELLTAAYANAKLSDMRSLVGNRSRVSKFVDSFIYGHRWSEDVHRLDRMAAITKQDVIDWARKYLGDDNYAVVYKHVGVNPMNKKIDAPEITPIATNREMQSDFLSEIAESEVKPIEPVFVNFSKDMSKFTAMSQKLEGLYKLNTDNDIATLSFRFDTGLADDPALGFAFSYLSYLGTAEKSAVDIAFEEYKLACSHNLNAGANVTQMTVSGLAENVGKNLKLYEDLIMNAVPDEEILANLKADELKARQMSKLSQQSCNSALQRYVLYGGDYVKTVNLTNEQLMALTSEELLSKIRNLFGYRHRILYYGPDSEKGVQALLSENHKPDSNLAPLVRKFNDGRKTPESRVYIAPYDQRQFNYIQYSNRGEVYSPDDAPQIELFNEYFGGGMNTVVFQEMREARALAYSAGAYLASPAHKDGNYMFYATIGSQNDKLRTAVETFDQIINDMPQSEKSFQIAKTGLESVLRTRRTNGISVLESYLSAELLGLDEPEDKTVFEHLQSLEMDDIVKCQNKWVKDRTYIYGILGDPADLDIDFLRTLGPVELLTLEDIFGY